VPFEHNIIDLSSKPQELVDKYAEAVGKSGRWVSAKVPLLEHGNRLVIESEDVAKYVAQNVHAYAPVGDRGSLLSGTDDDMYPVNDPDTTQRIDRFLDEWHSVVNKYYDYLSASSESIAKSKREAFCESLKALEKVMSISGPSPEGQQPPPQGEFCIGETFSIAECIAAPWVQRFFVTLPYFRGVDFGEQVLPADCVKVSRWMDAVRHRPSVIASACPEEEILAAARKYYVSYVSAGAPGVV